MSRRNYKVEQSYIEWLKSLGCVLYLPLTEGDLQDKISGNYIQLTGDGSMVWDANKSMYKVTSPSTTNRYVGKLNGVLDRNLFDKDNYTVIGTVKRITTSIGKYAFTACISNSDAGAVNINPNNTGNVGNWPDGLIKYAYSSSHTLRNRSIYMDGVLYSTIDEYIPYLPSRWSIDSDMSLKFFVNRGNNAGNVNWYIRDYYLFHEALDLSTIRKIQGYDN